MTIPGELQSNKAGWYSNIKHDRADFPPALSEQYTQIGRWVGEGSVYCSLQKGSASRWGDVA